MIHQYQMSYDPHQVLLGKQNLIQKDGETIYISKNLKYFLMFISCINQKERKT